jgi:hypothetical protein
LHAKVVRDERVPQAQTADRDERQGHEGRQPAALHEPVVVAPRADRRDDAGVQRGRQGKHDGQVAKIREHSLTADYMCLSVKSSEGRRESGA